jgi:protein-S-isoprenylcysteine O-methyltransferase Ste14
MHLAPPMSAHVGLIDARSRIHSSVRTRLRHSLSDWGGFVGHAAIAVTFVVRAPDLTLFYLPSIVHMLLVAWSFLIRERPRAQLRNPVGRVLAYVTAYGMLLFVQVASTLRPEWILPTSDTRLLVAGSLCALAGILLEISALWHLRRSFATEPAARQLVRTGPYCFTRHPIYVGGGLATIGLLMTRPTLVLASTVVVWLVCTRLRIGYEETILLDAFPEYADYQCRVGVIPRRAAV